MTEGLESKIAQTNFKARYKWFFLAAVLLCEIAHMYNLQAIYTIQVPIQERYHLDEIQFSRIITFESIPGLAVPLSAGLLADKYGSSLIFAIGLIMNYLGQFITTYSSHIANYWVLIAGRVLLVSGLNTMTVSKNKMFKNWFNNKEIAKALSTCSLIDYTAIILCDIGYPNIYEQYDSLFVAFMVGSVFIASTAIFGIIQVFLNAKLLRFGNIENPQGVPPSEKSIRNFPRIYWLLITCCVTGFLSYYGTKIYSAKFFQITFHFTVGEAGIMLAVAMAASGGFAMLTGYLLDRFGKVSMGVIIACLVIITGVSGNLIFPHCFRCVMAVAPLVVLSIGGSIVQLCNTVGVLRLIKAQSLGVALSFYSLIQAFLMMLYPMLGGYISEKTISDSGYFWVFLMNLGFGIVAVTLALVLFVVDKKGDKKLSMVPPVSVRGSYAILPDGGNQLVNEISADPSTDPNLLQSQLLVNDVVTSAE